MDVVTVAVAGGYRARAASLTAMTHRANATKMLRFSTPARLYLCDTLLQRLPQDLQDMAAELGELIQEEHAIVGQRHLAWHRHVAATDQPRIRDGMVGRTKGSSGDQRRTVSGQAGDAVDARGLNGLGEGHHRQDSGQPPCQHRLTRPRRS